MNKSALYCEREKLESLLVELEALLGTEGN